MMGRTVPVFLRIIKVVELQQHPEYSIILSTRELPKKKTRKNTLYSIQVGMVNISS